VGHATTAPGGAGEVVMETTCARPGNGTLPHAPGDSEQAVKAKTAMLGVKYMLCKA
jgi:hypothetical protein